MKVIGFFIVLNAIGLTAWWVGSDHAHKGWVVTVCFIALFFGIFMILQDKAVELTIKGIGTIKAAEKQVTADANTISDLKKRVESQSATVDLVAKSAEEARKLVDELTEKSQETDKKLGKLNEAAVNAQKALKEIDKTTEFATVLLAAQSDDWKSFVQLRKWGEDNSFPLQEMAANACIQIINSYSGPFRHGYLDYRWPPGVDYRKLSLQEFMNYYKSLNPIFHTHIVNKVWNRGDIPKKERMAFLIEVIKTSNSMTARDYAGEFFVEATGDKNLKWKTFQIEPLLRWWEEHGESIQ
jgi:hypothetical protein